MQANFEALFKEFDPNVEFVYFRSFKRVRMAFSSPQLATTARLYCDHLSFKERTLNCFFAQV